MADSDSENFTSLPPNYVSIAQLQERWLKEKQRKQQEEEEKEKREEEEKKQREEEEKKQRENLVRQNLQKGQNHSGYGKSHHTKIPVGKNLQKGGNHCGNIWREVGLIAKGPKSKVVAPVVEDGVDGTKKKRGHFKKRKPRVERNGAGDVAKVSTIDVAKEEMMMTLVEEGVDGTRKKVEKKKGCLGRRKPRVERDGTRDMGKVSTIDVAKEEIMAVNSVGKGKIELSKGKNQLNRKDEEVKEKGRPVIHRISNSVPLASGISRLSKNKVVTASTIDVAKEEIMTVDSVAKGGSEQSKAKNQLNRKDEEVKEKGRPIIHQISNSVPMALGVSRLSKDKEVKEVGNVCMVEAVGENKVDREIPVRRNKIGYRVKRDGRRMMEQSVQKINAEKEVDSADVKERTKKKVSVGGALSKHGHLQRDLTGDVANVSATNMTEEEVTTVVSVGNGGKELSKCINQLKSNDEEINEVGAVYMVEVVGEYKVDKEIPVQRSTVGFRGKQGSRRMMGTKFGEVGDKADSVEQSQKENNAEEEVVSDNLKEIANEKEGVRGGNGYDEKRGDAPLVVSEANLKIESNFQNLSLSDRRYGYGRSSDRMYVDKRRYRYSRRYDPPRMLKRRDSSFRWVKKGESLDGNVAEIETQVDSSSQSTRQSQQCSK